MRLSPAAVEAIRDAARAAFDDAAEVRLFGSRVDDRKRGGDIDLLVTSPGPLAAADELRRVLRFRALIERRLGERKLDVVVETPGDTRPIVRLARAEGIRLL